MVYLVNAHGYIDQAAQQHQAGFMIHHDIDESLPMTHHDVVFQGSSIGPVGNFIHFLMKDSWNLARDDIKHLAAAT